MFSYPGRLKHGDIAPKYYHLIGGDTSNSDYDDQLWNCWYETAEKHIQSIERFLNLKKEDVASQIDNSITCEQFGDFYFAVYLMCESVNNTLKEIDIEDESINDNDLEQILDLEKNCSQTLALIENGFSEETIDYEIWKNETLESITCLIKTLEVICKSLEVHNADMETIFDEMGKKLREIEQAVTRCAN